MSAATHEPTAVFETGLHFANRRQGKVRDIYDLPPDPKTGLPRLLIIATDRVSAFDVVMPTPIPGKGELLTQLSRSWFRFIEERKLAKTHMLPTTDDVKTRLASKPGHPDLAGRSMVARRCEVVPIECVVRGYIEGSGWKEYKESGTVCGVPLPAGLQRGGKLPTPIFTPATKAEIGAHDENITFEQACDIVGKPVMEKLRAMSLAIYNAAAAHALARGIILADTKFEFGWPLDAKGQRAGDELMLVDEALTPDSSRYWPLDQWKPGGAQESFDKQYLREYLEGMAARGQWNKSAPGPALPREVVEGTVARYREAVEKLS